MGSATGQRTSSPVVLLHVGAPKTGTTFLQDVLWHHRDRLRDDGVLFARHRYSDHFRASLDLRDVSWALRDDPSVSGAWTAVADMARAWTGTAVISHELFAAATPPQVRRAMESLEPAQVHVVYTVRDLWRQLPAEWQESTKHGRALSFAEFLDDVITQGRSGAVGRWFWSVHDAVDVLERWGAVLPAEQVHVVTVPPAGASPALLWERFAGLVGIDPQRYPTDVARPNASLGAAETDLLRRVNAALDGSLPRRVHGRLVKELLAQQVLAARPGKQRVVVPADRYPWARSTAEHLVSGLGSAGYHVVGDLTELLPPPPEPAASHPDDVPAREVLAAATDAIVALAARMATVREDRSGVDGSGVGGDSTTARDARAGDDAAAATSPLRTAAAIAAGRVPGLAAAVRGARIRVRPNR